MLVAALDDLAIPYHVGGSVASSALSFYRATGDVDLVADLVPAHVAALVERLEEDYFIDAEMVLEAIRDRSSFNLVHLPTAMKLDVFIAKHGPYDRIEATRVFTARLADDADAVMVRLISAEDVILRKLLWYRAGHEVSERQWLDVLGVLKVQWPALDLTYLRHWASELGVADLLAEAITEAKPPP